VERFVTVLTPVYLNVPERIEYLETTLESFYRCSFFPGKLIHNLVDDRSPLGADDLVRICRQYKIECIARMEEAKRRSFFDVFTTLLDSVETEFMLYLEPDHYFFQPYDFITPAVALLKQLPELHQVYLRVPLVYRSFERVDPLRLRTPNGTVLERVVIDPHNTGWVGKGIGYESFSLMPSLFRTEHLRSAVRDQFVSGGPAELEMHFAKLWERQKLVGYLNGQAFCYHIGAAGKQGPGGYLQVGDLSYEASWSKREL